MLKNKKGVTLGVLVVSIIVMFVIFGVTMSAGTDLIRNADKNRLVSTLFLVKSRAATLFEDYLFDKSTDSLNNLGTTATSDQIALVDFTEDGTSEYIYTVWNISKLEEEGIDTEDVASTESFIIQYNVTKDTVDVASTKGYEDEDGNTIHSLSKLEEN